MVENMYFNLEVYLIFPDLTNKICSHFINDF